METTTVSASGLSGKHLMFARELLAASGVDGDVHAASRYWELHHFDIHTGAVKDRPNCQLCHAELVNIAVIRNVKNDMQLTIGHDCLEKLHNLQASGKVESVSLSTWKEYRTEARKHIEKALGGKRGIIAAVTKWLAAEAQLPPSIKDTLGWLEKFGTPQSLEKAEELVAYYKATRRFPVVTLMSASEFALYSSSVSPEKRKEEMTLDDFAKMREALARLRIARERREKRAFAAKKATLDALLARGVPAADTKISSDWTQFEITFSLPKLPCRAVIKYPYGQRYTKEQIVETAPEILRFTPRDILSLFSFGHDVQLTLNEEQKSTWLERLAARKKTDDDVLEERLVAVVRELGDTFTVEMTPEILNARPRKIRTTISDIPVFAFLGLTRPTHELLATLPSTLRLVRPTPRSAKVWGKAEITADVHPDDIAAWNKRLDERAEQERHKELERVLAEKATLREKKTQLDKRLHELRNDPNFLFGRLFAEEYKGRSQWKRNQSGGIRYVLDRNDKYDPEEGLLLFRKGRHLVPGRVILLHRVYVSEIGNHYQISAHSDDFFLETI